MVTRLSINILHLPPSESENACHLDASVSWYSTSKGRYHTVLSTEGIRRRIYIRLGTRDLHLLKAKSLMSNLLPNEVLADRAFPG